jgi:hypothetical protein
MPGVLDAEKSIYLMTVMNVRLQLVKRWNENE